AAQVMLERKAGRVYIRVTATDRLPGGGAVVQLVTYTPQETVKIRRGENAGRTLTYYNIVRDFVEIGRWDGRG
ncbi:MAG: DUF1223 domain-containing protein, partial [Burkholderiales bacterium]|nr:DUF1223 domain-containing protein [Burkholderiales bacterium]